MMRFYSNDIAYQRDSIFTTGITYAPLQAFTLVTKGAKRGRLTQPGAPRKLVVIMVYSFK